MSIVDPWEGEKAVEEIYLRAGAPDDEAWLPSRLALALLGRPVRSVANLKGLAKLEGEGAEQEIVVRRTLSPEIAEWAVGHELGHLVGVTSERLCNFVGAAILMRRGPFLHALASRSDDWEGLAVAFGTTSTSVVLRAGELTGRALAVVTPARVYARGLAEWPDEATLRRWARHGGPGVRRAVLRDDPRRVVLEGEEETG
jgi:hypothetical protein